MVQRRPPFFGFLSPLDFIHCFSSGRSADIRLNHQQHVSRNRSLDRHARRDACSQMDGTCRPHHWLAARRENRLRGAAPFKTVGRILIRQAAKLSTCAGDTRAVVLSGPPTSRFAARQKIFRFQVWAGEYKLP
jgi:hypothetical protein